MVAAKFPSKTLPGGGGQTYALDTPGLAARVEYDPLCRRIARTVNGETTAYLYDGAQAIGEIRGAQTTTVMTGVAMDEALARYAGSGRLEQLTDHLGSVIRRIGEDGSTRSRTAYIGREDDGTSESSPALHRRG